jgi:hypothetical protein
MDLMSRIVVVASGFGLWRDGRHVASARWSDVVGVHASAPGPDAPVEGVEIELADGRVLALDGTLPGWRDFVHAAGSRLTGMPRNTRRDRP